MSVQALSVLYVVLRNMSVVSACCSGSEVTKYCVCVCVVLYRSEDVWEPTKEGLDP